MVISGGVSSFFAAFLKALSVLADAWVTHGQSARSSAGSLHFREKKVMDSEMKGRKFTGSLKGRRCTEVGWIGWMGEWGEGWTQLIGTKRLCGD